MRSIIRGIGMLKAELTSAELETVLTQISSKGIELKNLSREGELCCHFWLKRKDLLQLTALCERRGETLRIIKNDSLQWMLQGLKSRPVLLAGIVLLLTMVCFLPTRIFFVQVEGNALLPEKLILDTAENCGITFGAKRLEVRSEKMKNALLAAIPQLKWAGVNTHGCVAVISVRESTAQKTTESKNTVASVIAARDGYILSGTVTRGNGLFQIGQTVTEGQVLISGYTDCGLYIQAERAEGEIYAQTVREIDAVMPSEYLCRAEKKSIRKKYSLLIRKKRINLWKDSGISDTTCGRMYEEYYITLPGGFRLPIALCVETYTFGQTNGQLLNAAAAEQKLSAFTKQYLLEQMIAGTIAAQKESISEEDGRYRLSGRYVCVEMIGREQQEQIGDTNGKND